MQKVCRGCNIEQPIVNFYRHKRMGDGHLNFCKPCVKERVRRHRQEQLDRIRQYDRQRGDLPHRVESRQRYQALMPKEQRDLYRQRWRERNPEREKIRNMVSNAVRDGKLKVKPCERCGFAIGVHAHHEDYSKPLDVTWLCRRCHGQRHREINEERRRAS